MGYSDVILADSPNGYWRLGDAGSTAADLGSGAHTGTIAGGVTKGVAGPLVNDSDGAMTFDGVAGSKITTVNNVSIGTNTSVEFWFKTTFTSQQVAFSNRASGGIYLGTNSNTLFVFLNSGTPGSRFGVNSTACNGAWHHAVWTNDGTTTVFYFDGAVDATLAQTPGGPYNHPPNISFDADSSQVFNGSLDEVAVYTTLLSATQVATHYKVGKTKPLPRTLGSPQPVKRGAYY